MYRVEILFDDKLTHFFLIIVGFIGLFLFGLGFWYGCLFGWFLVSYAFLSSLRHGVFSLL